MADGMQNLSFSSSLNGGKKSSHVLNRNQEELLSSLMAKLRTTSQQIKTWSDTSRKIRTVMAQCQEPASVDANRLQQCLDQLKLAIKGSMSLPAMVERLKALAKQAGLKFHTNQNAREVFISSDVFYVEVMLESSGMVEDVQIYRQNEPVSCPEMRDCLRQSNFKGFLDHLKGLHSFYQLPCEFSVKRDAFKCLQTLEDDLKKVFKNSCSTTSNVMVLILKGFVGFVTPRIGGYPMRLTFFVSPYDLLNVEKKTSTVLNMSDPLPEDMGLSVSVNLDGSSNRKLQSSSTLNVPALSDGKKGPHFVQLNNSNCMTLPASFVLKLNKPMPLSTVHIKRLAINQSMTSAAPLNSLICRHAQDPMLPADTKPTPHNRFYVTLPGEQHCYLINECHKDMKGVMVSTIPLTCTSQAIVIVSTLRQQAIYNTLLASCVRSDTCKDESDVSLFEVSTVSFNKFTITFEHPAKIGMACVEMDLVDVSDVKCVIHAPHGEEPLCCNTYATKVLQKCMSIPVTMRAILKVANSKMDKYWKPLSSSAVPAMFPPGSGNILPPNAGKGINGATSTKPGSTTMNYITGKKVTGRTMPKSILSDISQSMVTLFSPSLTESQKQDLKSIDDSKVSQNPMLASLLQNTAFLATASNTKPPQNPMLMDLLRVQVPQGSPVQVTSPGVKTKEVKSRRKRKSTSDNRSPRQSNEDLSDDPVFFPPGTPSSTVAHQTPTSVPTTRYPSVSDLSTIMTPPGGLEPKFSFSSDALNHSMDFRHKRLDSTSSQGSSSWPMLSPQTPTAWSTNRTSGTRSTLDTPENDMIMQGDIPSTPVEKTPSANIPEQGSITTDSHDLTENLPLHFFSTGGPIEDDFPEIDAVVLSSEVNLLESEEGSAFDLVNMTLEPNNLNRNSSSFPSDFIDYKPKLEKGQLSSSYPLQSSGKPSLMSRRLSSDSSLTSMMNLDLTNTDLIKQRKPVTIPDAVPVKQPFVSKGKPKNFKPDIREGSLSPEPSPHPPKKAKRKTRRRETIINSPALEHPKKARRKRKLEPENEPQTNVSFILTASSDPLKIKFSRTGSDTKKQTQLTSEPKKVGQASTDIKPPKITLRLAHPPAGETSDVNSSEPEPKKEPDRKSVTERKSVTTENVGDVFSTTKPSGKPLSVEKRKAVSTEQPSKTVRYDTKQNPSLNKSTINQKVPPRDISVPNQKVLSRDVLTGQKAIEGKLQTGVKKVITIQKPGSSPTTKTVLTKKLATQKAKFGSIKTTSSKAITQGQHKPASLTSPPNVSSKPSSTPGSTEVLNRTTSSSTSNMKSTSVFTVSKPISSTKVAVSKPPPLTIVPSNSSNVASPRLITTPVSGTALSAGAAALKKNKSSSRFKTINSIAEALQMKAQKQNQDDHDTSTQDVKEVPKPTTSKADKPPDTPISRPHTMVSSPLLEADKRINAKVPMVIKTQRQKVGSVMPSKPPTYSSTSKPGTPRSVPKAVSPSSKVSLVTGRPSSSSSPKQSRVASSPSRSLPTSNPNRIASPTSTKIQQKTSSPSKTISVQKSPSSPMKPLVKASGSPSSVPRKPNILSKAPKSTGSPKNKVLGVTSKVTPQMTVSHQIRHGLISDGSRKQTVGRTSSNHGNTSSSTSSVSSKTSVAGENIAKTNNTSKVEKVTVMSNISSEVCKSDTQLAKKTDSDDTTKLVNNSKSDTSKIKEQTGESKESFRRKLPHVETVKHAKLNTDAKPKKELSQKTLGVDVNQKNSSREVLSKSSGSPATQFKVPSPAVLTNSKPLSASPKPPVSTSKSALKAASPSSSNVTSDQQVSSIPGHVAAKGLPVVRAVTVPSGKGEGEPVSPKKKNKPVSLLLRGDGESDNELIIDDLPEGSNTEIQENKQLTRKVHQPVNTSSDTQTESGSTSPRSMIVQSPLGIMASSPLGQVASPLVLPVKSPAAMSCASNQASPCPIDDDLMDEALVSVISKEDN